jgi:hypothetical protein
MTGAFLLVCAGLLANGLGSYYFNYQAISAGQNGQRVASRLYEAAGASLFPALGFVLAGIGLVLLSLTLFDLLASRRASHSSISTTPLLREELQRALNRAEATPGKAGPAWDLARVKLELYFDRNLTQIKQIFLLSAGVMIAGFVFVLVSIILAFTEIGRQNAAPSMTPAWIGGIAGVITEFIGATFLFVYKSTVQQAASYTQTLERINSVGMAMQILDTISEDSKDLQDSTKAEIVKLLLQQAGPAALPSSKAHTPEKTKVPAS